MQSKRPNPGWISEDFVVSHDEIMDQVSGNGPPPKKSAKLLQNNTKKASMRPCGLKTRQHELEQLGEPDDRSTCFGCCYVGEHDAGAIAYEDIMAILNMVRRSIARADPITLVKHVAQRYRQIQREVNDNLQPGESPLPDWSEATILEHLRSHNTDPELQQWMRASEMQELAQIALRASVVLNPDNGELSIDEKQCKMYLEIVKSLETFSKSDPSKKAFYSSGGHIDMSTASQGPISLHGKRLIRYLKKKDRL